MANDETIYYARVWCEESGLSIYVGGMTLAECWKTYDENDATSVMERFVEECTSNNRAYDAELDYTYDGEVCSITRKELMKKLLNGEAHKHIQKGYV